MQTGASRPTEGDVVLLRTVMGPPDDRAVNFAAWTGLVDIDHLTPAAYSLLPALSQAMEPLGSTHPWMARLRGVHRREWTQRQRHLATTAAISEVLTDAGITHLDPADQQISRLLDDPTLPRLDPPQLVVDWWSGPAAVNALVAAGWSVDTATPAAGVRARLTRSGWALSSPSGAPASIATAFLPFLVDERRESDLWERARSTDTVPPSVHPADLAVAALCRELALPGAVGWAPAAVGVLDATGPIDLGPVLDRRVARLVLPTLRDRLAFLESERLGHNIDDLRSQVEHLIDAHPLPTTPSGRAAAWLAGRARAVRRQPRALSEIHRRHGGWAGVVAAARAD